MTQRPLRATVGTLLTAVVASTCGLAAATTANATDTSPGLVSVLTHAAAGLPCSLAPGPSRLGDETAPVGQGVVGTGARPAVEKPIHSNGTWFLDNRGRVRIFHGTNMTRKLAPYTPSSIGFGSDDVMTMKAAGFNTIRLGFIWKAFEPQPGKYDMQYLADYAGTVKELTSRGVYVLVDSHQDQYNEAFNGEGFPDWATFGDGLPTVPNCGFPLNYFLMPSLHRAWDHLWANDVRDPLDRTLWQAYAQMWQQVAREFRDDPRVFGYDILNEPFPGSSYLACVNPLIGCIAQDRKLEAFQRYVGKAIRAVDPNTTIYYEPYVPADFGAASSMRNPVGANAAYSFHSYCILGGPGTPPVPGSGPVCSIAEKVPLIHADQRRDAGMGVPMLSEFGAINDPALLDRVANAADSQMMSWQQWTWWGEDPSADRPDEGLLVDPTLPPTGSNVHWDRLGALVRAYPRAIAGTPTSWSYNAKTRTFSLSYTTTMVGNGSRFPAGATSVIFLPRLHFSHGFDVLKLQGASLRHGLGQTLKLRSLAGAGRVDLVIRAR